MAEPALNENIEKDWEKAVSYTFNDEDIERAKLLIGRDVASREREYVTTASWDNIRNFAHGVGNDNPLHCDQDYGAATRWGSIIAPTMMAGIINMPLRGDKMDPEIKARTKGLFRGIHVFVSGGEWTFYNPIYPGDTIYSYAGEETLEVKPSEFAGRTVTQIRRDVKFNQRGEVVGVYKIRRILSERKSAAKKGKYAEIKPATYTDEDIARIDEIYANEKVRGAEKRFWEDVSVGESLGTMAKGPLTVTDVVCFHAGGYGFVPYVPCVGRLAYRNRQRIAPFYIKNEQGVPDVAQRLHWDPKWAQAVGNPMAYDYGVMRENYIYHYLTDWCGDDGWVVRQYDEIRKFNYMGDTQIITGEVVAKRQENGRHLVDVVVAMTNQRDEKTVSCEATIALPSKTDGPVVLPDVPLDLRRRTAEIWARHGELLRETRKAGA
ncbi:MAG: MaoC family dehydratase N-terminal domain-containing protein [Hydrogenophilaceae bacterium]|jgi:acyl dehydratase|nr:MaoC family dehydratase N-terminal domain-containing protein [Hydrogenophilaceae bacterium]